MPTPDLLTLHAGNTPDKLALVDDRPDGKVETLSFSQFNEQVNRLCNAWLDRGVRRNDKIVWCGMNSIGVVRAMHAARKIGATAVPLNYRLTPEEAAYVVDHCDAVLVYTDAEFVELFTAIRSEIPKVRDIVVFGGAPGPDMLDGAALLADASSDEPPQDETDTVAATMIYTSGTTGKPKGAMRRGLGDRSQLQEMIALIGYVPEDVFLTTGPLYHSGPGGFMVITQMLGGSVVIQRKFDAEDWLRLTSKYQVTTTFSAPTAIRMICNLPDETKQKYDTRSMRRMVANAAPWSYALKQAYLADFSEDSLWEVYGSTELGVNAILAPEDQLRKPGSCGLPAPHVDLKLFNEDGEVIAEANVPGELFARSKTVFDTYYKAHDRYEEERRGEYHTVGDIAYFDDEGYFYICDRKKDMIISGGMNIYPAEIEASLEQHPRILDVAVFGIPSEQWGESVHATIVPKAGQSLSEDDIEEFAREHLASYKIPRSIEFTTEIPRTGSVKILKRVLRAPYWKDHGKQVI